MRAAVLAALLLAAPAQVRLSAETPPAFPSTLEIVLVDVSVLDSGAQPITDLIPADFTLTVQGRPRRVVSAEFVPGTDEATTPAQPQPEYYSTNEHVRPGRIVILLIDTGNIPPGQGRAEIDAAKRLLDRLRPPDRVGLLTTSRGGPRVELTADHALVRRTLDHLVGRAARPDKETANEQALTLPLDVLQATFDVLKEVEGRKTVVLVTPGLARPDDEPGVFRRLGTAAAEARCVLFCVSLRLSEASLAPETAAVVAPAGREDGAAAAARVGRDVDASAPGTPDATEIQASSSLNLGELVQETGGSVLTGWPEQAFERIAREISGLYLVGFEPEPEDRDGKRHAIRVSVARPGVTVRARRSVHIPPAADSRSAEEALALILRAPHLATGLPLRVATHALAASAGAVKVLISTELARGAFSSGLRIAHLLVDAKGKVVASGEHKPTTVSETATAGPFTTALTVKPGEYTLKVAARDAAGRVGRVDAPVRAVLQKTTDQDTELSDLLLGLPPSAGVPFRPGVSLEVDGRSLVAYVEIYGRDPESLKQTSVAMEIAQDEAAPTLRVAPARIVDAPAGGRRVAQAALPLQDLAPGRYLVRAVALRGGRALATVTHPFRLVPPAPPK